MIEQIRCITNEGKTAKNEWQNNDSDFLLAFYSVCKKLGQFFFHTLLANLFKQRYISSVTSYKYLNKLIREKEKEFRKRKIHIVHHRTPNSIYACILPHAY